MICKNAFILLMVLFFGKITAHQNKSHPHVTEEPLAQEGSEESLNIENISDFTKELVKLQSEHREVGRVWFTVYNDTGYHPSNNHYNIKIQNWFNNLDEPEEEERDNHVEDHTDNRQLSQRVTFKTPFKCSPSVFLMNTQLDYDSEKTGMRFSVRTQNTNLPPGQDRRVFAAKSGHVRIFLGQLVACFLILCL